MNLDRSRIVGVGVVFVLATFLSFAGCGGSQGTSSNASPTIDSGNGGMIYADNWSEIAIDANLSNTKVLSSGHFETTHNACNRAANAAMSLSDWNNLAEAVNAALKQVSTTLPKVCFDVDYTSCMDGKASIMLGDGTEQVLFEPGDSGQTCSSIQDRDLAQKLFKVINGITYTADHTDCTLEWERCSR